jgi:hypothetical protein
MQKRKERNGRRRKKVSKNMPVVEQDQGRNAFNFNSYC